jgi:acyl dehydratase
MGALLLRAAGTFGRRGAGLGDRLSARYQVSALPAASLAAYQAFFGGFTSTVPLTALYPLAQRAQLALMLGGAFPYAVPGMVHVSNAMKRVGGIDPAVGFELAVSVAPPETSPESGVRLTFEVTLSQGGAPCVTCESVYLARRGTGSRSAARQAPVPAPDAHQEPWWLAADEGLRYAQLSGDYNPIHLSPWLSRFFGFKRPIMHGMDALGRTTAAIERQSAGPVTAIDVAFKRPVFLPAEVHLAWGEETDGAGRFVVESANGTRHMEGHYSL